jgi:hypothetical protein
VRRERADKRPFFAADMEGSWNEWVWCRAAVPRDGGCGRKARRKSGGVTEGSADGEDRTSAEGYVVNGLVREICVIPASHGLASNASGGAWA